MDFELSQLLIVCPLIFCAGLMNGITGGGGLIGLPAFILAGVPMHYAMGTNKMSAIPGTLVAAIRYYRNGFINTHVLLVSVLLAFAGAAVGVHFALMLNEQILEKFLLVVIPFTSFYVFRNKKLAVDGEISRRSELIRSALISGALGFYDGFYGPGVGTFYALLFNKFAKMDIRIASGNAKCVNLASNITSAALFLINGKVIFLLALCTAVFSMLGGHIGAGLVIRNGAKIIRPFLFVVLTVIFVRTVFRVL